jgi:hypothetical protein
MNAKNDPPADYKFRLELDAFLDKNVGVIVHDDWAVVETLMRATVRWGVYFDYDADRLKELLDKILMPRVSATDELLCRLGIPKTGNE